MGRVTEYEGAVKIQLHIYCIIRYELSVNSVRSRPGTSGWEGDGFAPT